MILLLIGSISLVCLGIWMINNWRSDFLELMGLVSALMGVIFLVVYCVLIVYYVGSEHKANIINAKCDTNYTQQEVFYALDEIKEINKICLKNLEK